VGSFQWGGAPKLSLPRASKMLRPGLEEVMMKFRDTSKGSISVHILCSTSQTSNIIKNSPLDQDTLKETGVDTNTFSVHSVQGASASTVGRGLHIADVLKTADWSRESTSSNSVSSKI